MALQSHSFSVGTVQTLHVALSTLTFSSLPAAVQAQLNVAQDYPHPEASSILSIAADTASFSSLFFLLFFSFFFFKGRNSS